MAKYIRAQRLTAVIQRTTILGDVRWLTTAKDYRRKLKLSVWISDSESYRKLLTTTEIFSDWSSVWIRLHNPWTSCGDKHNAALPNRLVSFQTNNRINIELISTICNFACSIFVEFNEFNLSFFRISERFKNDLNLKLPKLKLSILKFGFNSKTSN